jgi:FAD/FMN-containing dehydrogenase
LSIFVEAGTTLLELNQYLDKFGLFFPLKIASEASCQIGGNIATNAGGINVVKYGMMRNLVLGLEVITSNGEIINQTKVLYKDNTNFDIKQLFIGSEGTLGIVTKAVLKVYSKPQTITTIYLGVDSITQALDLKTKLNTNGFSISAFEIISKYTLEVYNNAFCDLHEPLKFDWYLLIDIDNNEESLTVLSSILCSFSSSCIVATSTKERQYLWQIRERIPLAEKLSKPSVKFDISLPLDNIEIFLHQVGEGLKCFDYNIYMVVFGHLGDGNLHFNLQLDDIGILSTIRDELSVLVYSTLIELNGSISAEHGIGVAKKYWYQKYEDPITFKYKKLIKNILDPKNIFNPNVIY